MRFAAFLLPLPLLLVPLAQPQGEELPSDSSAIVTLYAQDDLQSSFDFRHGSAGGRVAEGEVVLLDAQIAFGVFEKGHITVGLVRRERVELLDLGSVSVPSQPLALERSVEFPLSLFHTLFFDGARFHYVGPGGDVHAYDQADRILRALPPDGLRHVEPVVGHVYLVRVRRDGVGSRDEFFKFQVIDLEPERFMTIRWARVPGR